MYICNGHLLACLPVCDCVSSRFATAAAIFLRFSLSKMYLPTVLDDNFCRQVGLFFSSPLVNQRLAANTAESTLLFSLQWWIKLRSLYSVHFLSPAGDGLYECENATCNRKLIFLKYIAGYVLYIEAKHNLSILGNSNHCHLLSTKPKMK